MMSERHEKKGTAEAATSPARGSNIPSQESAVNEANDTTASGDDASTPDVSVEELAALDFDALSGRPEDTDIHSNEEWAQFGIDWLPTVHLANLFLFRSKADIVGFVAEDPDAHAFIIEEIDKVTTVLQSYVDLLEEVRLRLLVCLAVHSLGTSEAGQ